MSQEIVTGVLHSHYGQTLWATLWLAEGFSTIKCTLESWIKDSLCLLFFRIFVFFIWEYCLVLKAKFHLCCQNCKYFQVLHQMIVSIFNEFWEKLPVHCTAVWNLCLLLHHSAKLANRQCNIWTSAKNRRTFWQKADGNGILLPKLFLPTVRKNYWDL